MTTVTPARRSRIDVNDFRPEDLAGLSEEAFRAVVDADLRRKAPKSGIWLREDLIAALRQPEHATRWHAMLLRMQKSVDGTLGAREADYQAQRAELDVAILQLETKRDSSEGCRDPDSGQVLSAEEVARRLTSLKVRRLSLRATHMKTKASTVRFKTGLDEATLEARSRRDLNVSTIFETAVAMERDFYADYCRALVAAVEAHRASVLDDLDGVEEPDGMDTTLWGALRSSD